MEENQLEENVMMAENNATEESLTETNHENGQALTNSTRNSNIAANFLDEYLSLFCSLGIRHSNCEKTCKTNRTGNLACFCGLGQSRWKVKTVEDPAKEKSPKTKESLPSGLKNLSATCYVNSYLQVWYHNVAFRNAIYSIKSEDHPEVSKWQQIIKLIFGLLQRKKVAVVDPSELIELLKINANRHQDVFELNTLMRNKLETIPAFKTMFDEELKGMLVCKIMCLTCQQVTICEPEEFYEYNIKTTTTKAVYLDELIRQDLKTVTLDGSNQYNCKNCNKLCDANKSTDLVRLPNTLCFRIDRCSFDGTTGRSVKINQPIRYCERMDMKKFMTNSEGQSTTEYVLTSILLHRGGMTNCGHFVVHQRISDQWYLFNDEEVSKVSQREQLASTSDPIVDMAVPKKRRKKNNNGAENTDDAYMLLYTRADKMASSNAIYPLPEDLLDRVLEVEKEVEEKKKQEINLQRVKIQEENSKIEEKIAIGKMMYKPPLHESSQCYWVPTQLIKKFFQMPKKSTATSTSSPTESKENKIDFDSLLCPHGKLHPESLSKFKIVPAEATEHFYCDLPDEVSTDIRNLSGSKAICSECSELYFQDLELQSQLLTDVGLVNSKITALDPNNAVYLVGKQSFKLWADVNRKVLNDKSRLILNSDIVCSHGVLKEGYHKRRSCHSMSSECWQIICKYYDKIHVVKSDDNTLCSSCQQNKENQQSLDVRLKEKAAMIKSNLDSLIRETNRPEDVGCKNGEKLFIVPDTFLKKLRAFSKSQVNYRKQNEVESCDELRLSVTNSEILCEKHRMLLYNPVKLIRDGNVILDMPKCVLLWPDEWQYVKETFGYDYELFMQARVNSIADEQPEEQKGDSIERIPINEGNVDLSHQLCESCREELEQIKLESDLNYEKLKFQVRRLMLSTTELGQKIAEDPAFLVALDKSPDRKTRRKKGGMETKAVVLSSSFTLKQMKLAICKAWGNTFFCSDVSVYKDGLDKLDDGEEESQTLEQLRVYKHTKLIFTEEKGCYTDMTEDEIFDAKLAESLYFSSDFSEEAFAETNLM